jgi:hypothetical protein
MPSSDTLYEEAKRCPKCKLPGFLRQTLPIPEKPGAKMEVFVCVNGDLTDPDEARCRWFNQTWLVQINRDGTIPQPNHSPDDKRFPNAERLDTVGRHYTETLMEQIQRGELREGEIN